MKVTATEIPDVLLIEPRVFEDERVFFGDCYVLNEQPLIDDYISILLSNGSSKSIE